MLNRSILTAIIGFLVGCLFYYMADASVVIVLIMGCSGYFVGLILDNADIKHQLDTFHFSNLSTQEIFQSADIPEALIFYSPKENLTTVSIDFQVDTKPQTFRLSVLKNLQEHQFRILEDSSKTMFSLTLDYPECNYPKILSSPNQKEKFHYDIKEHSLDFQNAIQKIIPGLVLSKISHTSPFGDVQIQTFLETSPNPSQFPPPASPSFDRLTRYDRGISHTSLNGASEENQEINESQIMEDLLPGLSSEIKIPDLSPEEVQHLKGSNQRQLEVFLNDNIEVIKEESLEERLASNESETTDNIEIDFSKVDQPVNDSTKEDFNQVIANRIEERTRITLNKETPDLELQKEREEIKKNISEEINTERSPF
ncbi:MAG: hypothetical protein JSW11_05280 [Candidatus Heimdallarchaeota archaeon]|nr:MAG: hypothetical protein JSW11_05280 [Candidatus Heimdallarchaeota archaeon]